ncbi:MAG: hypothetical protein EB078_01820 [Proteobacteria bacterium]|nr:hypothetical protein [Pseudomonadota bacterium]NDG19004.1 hypothetical protein [Betaproteobacteria bacterium]
MPAKRWTVCIDWVDGAVEDTDETVVSADSRQAAIAKAKKRWRLEIGARHPTCRIVRAFILTGELIAKMSY